MPYYRKLNAKEHQKTVSFLAKVAEKMNEKVSCYERRCDNSGTRREMVKAGSVYYCPDCWEKKMDRGGY